MRSGHVYFQNMFAGIITELEEGGYMFTYDVQYLSNPTAQPISLTLPLKQSSFKSKTLFPFFDGLIPEGWLLDIALHNWKLNRQDRMGIMLKTCRDCIGAVSIIDLPGGIQ